MMYKIILRIIVYLSLCSCIVLAWSYILKRKHENPCDPLSRINIIQLYIYKLINNDTQSDIFSLNGSSFARYPPGEHYFDRIGTKAVDLYYVILETSNASAEVGILIYKTNTGIHTVYYGIDLPDAIFVIFDSDGYVYKAPTNMSNYLSRYTVLNYLIGEQWKMPELRRFGHNESFPYERD